MRLRDRRRAREVRPRALLVHTAASGERHVIEIGEASEADISDLIRLYVELHEYSAGKVPSRLSIESRYNEGTQIADISKVIRDERAACLVAIDGRLAVGLAEVHVREPETDPGVVPVRRGYLQALIVARSHRNTGVGSALLTAAEDWARLRGATEMELDHW